MKLVYALADNPTAKLKFQELSAAYESIKSGKTKFVLVLRVNKTRIAQLSRRIQIYVCMRTS